MQGKITQMNMNMNTIRDSENGSEWCLTLDHSNPSVSSTEGGEFGIYSESCWLRAIELTPLSVKLLLCVLFAILSVILFGGVLIGQSVIALQEATCVGVFSNVTIGVHELLQGTQKERATSMLYLGGGGNHCLNTLRERRLNVDKLLTKAHRSMNTIDCCGDKFGIVKDMIRKVEQVEQSLPDFRRKIEAGELQPAQVMDFFANWNSKLLHVISLLASKVQSSELLFQMSTLRSVAKYSELISVEKAIGTYSLSTGNFSSTFSRPFTSSVDRQRDVLEEMLLTSEPSHAGFLSDRYIQSEVFGVVAEYEHHMIQKQEIANISAEVWYDNVTAKVDVLNELAKIVEASITESGLVSGRFAYTKLIIVAVTITLVISGCIASAVFFSRTIYRPWKKMIQLQEKTILNFVPREFLKLLGKTNITELRLGDHCVIELDIMFVDIRGFTSISEKLSPKELFSFLNSYLESIGPCFTSSNFIDSYIGDGIMAIFPVKSSSILAALAILDKVKQMNIRNQGALPEITIGIGINYGTAIAGLIGCKGRMQGTIVSDAVNTAARLESLTKRYGAKILATESTIQRLTQEDSVRIRYVGKVKVLGKENMVKVFQIITEDEIHLIKCTEMFSKGIRYMFEQPYDIQKARDIFGKLCDEVTEDAVSKLRFDQCTEMLACQGILSAWSGCDELTCK